MAHPVQKSSCQWLTDLSRKALPTAFLMMNPKAVAVVTSLLASCAVIKSGISDLCHRKFLKGTVKTLVGGAGAALSAAYMYSDSTKNSLFTVAQDSCPAPRSLEEQVDNRLAEVREEDMPLKQSVSTALQTGGQLVYNASASGLYLILSNLGKIIGHFKPSLERNWGPYNRDINRRRASPTLAEIHSLQLSGFHQGQPSERQYLARVLDFAVNARIPKGYMTTMRSNLFVDLAAESSGQPPSLQTRSGLLQEWLDGYRTIATQHPLYRELSRGRFPPEVDSVVQNPLIDRLPLHEYQEAAVGDVLLYNQDGHGRNYLYRTDAEGIPHLRPIDRDVILPFRLTDLVGLPQHRRAFEPFTESALRLIRRLDPDFVQAVALRLNLPQQALVNIKALALVLRRFSEANLTLGDIYKFISHPERNQDSPLWQMMQRVQDAAVNELSADDLQRYQYAQFLHWNHLAQIIPDEQELLRNYSRNDNDRIKQDIDRNYWRIFEENLHDAIASWRR